MKQAEYAAIDAHEDKSLTADFNANQCLHCLNKTTFTYCSDVCFYADNHPIIKIHLLGAIDDDLETYSAVIKSFKSMFDCCTEPTVNRGKRAIERRIHERDEIENYHENG